MNNQQKTQKVITPGDEILINDLNSQIYDLLNNYEIKPQYDFIFEHNNDLFRKICNKAKESLEYSNKKFDKEKLCYMIAVYVLKSGLYYVLEKAYKNGFDFENL